MNLLAVNFGVISTELRDNPFIVSLLAELPTCQNGQLGVFARLQEMDLDIVAPAAMPSGAERAFLSGTTVQEDRGKLMAFAQRWEEIKLQAA